VLFGGVMIMFVAAWGAQLSRDGSVK